MSDTTLRALRWGVVAPRPDDDKQVELSTTARTILTPDPNRVQVTLVNETANPVRVRWGADPTTTFGVPVSENGGFTRFSYEQDGERIFQTLRGISTGTTNVFVTTDVLPAAPRKVA